MRHLKHLAKKDQVSPRRVCREANDTKHYNNGINGCLLNGHLACGCECAVFFWASLCGACAAGLCVCGMVLVRRWGGGGARGESFVAG